MFPRKFFLSFYHMSILQKIFFVEFFFCFLLDGMGIVSKEIIFISFVFFSIVLGIFLLVSKKFSVIGDTPIWLIILAYFLYLFFEGASQAIFIGNVGLAIVISGIVLKGKGVKRFFEALMHSLGF